MVMPMSEREKKYWEEKQRKYLERCKERDEKNPPKNLARKVGRLIWDYLWMPQPPIH